MAGEGEEERNPAVRGGSEGWSGRQYYGISGMMEIYHILTCVTHVVVVTWAYITHVCKADGQIL